MEVEMKIAIIGSCKFQVPTEKGVIHAPLALTFNLAIELAKMGHDVTYFGKVDKEYTEKVKPLKIETPEYYDLPDLKQTFNCADSVRFRASHIYHQNYMTKILKYYQDFDVYYSWAITYIGPMAPLYNKPVVATHHDSTNMDVYNLVFKGFDEANLFMIPISEYMNKITEYGNKLGVVHHGIDPNEIVASESPEDYFCWLGRVSPSKGPDIAIEAAAKAGVKIKIAGPIEESLPDFGDVANFATKIKKLFEDHRHVEYLGSLSQQESFKLISNSKGLIFPTDGTESFSMVALEAIMAGTPVITTNKGPLPEIVKPGINGFLIDDEKDIDGFASAIAKIDTINRVTCRQDAINRFSLQKMAKGYEEQFNVAIEKRRHNGQN